MASDRTDAMAVFFTHGVSLELWEQRGMFSREVRLYEELARRVGEIWFFTYGRNDEQYRDQLGPHIRLFPKRVPIPDLAYGMLMPLLFFRELARADALRIHQVAGAVPALITHWLFHKPLIVRGGFQWYTFAIRRGVSRLKLGLILFLETLAYRSAHAIIHTTQQDADGVVRRYHIDPSKIHIVPNYVDTDLFKPMDVEKQAGTVCFTGRLEEQKNLQTLLEAMKDVPGTLVLYGEGSQRKQLEQAAHTLGVRAQFRGRIANEELPTALNACEVFILPSLYEGHPKALLEAMACGLPVIGTNVEGIRELIDHEKNGLLCDTSVTSIRSTITQLLGDQQKQRALGISARHTVFASYSLPTAINKEYEIFVSVLRQTTPSAA